MKKISLCVILFLLFCLGTPVDASSKTEKLVSDTSSISYSDLQSYRCKSDATCLDLYSLDLSYSDVFDEETIYRYCSLLRYCPNISEFCLSEDNEYLKVIDGVLYDKKGEILICCPPGKEGTVKVPKGVKTILENAFSQCNKITEIDLPSTINYIGDASFYKTTSLSSIKIDPKCKTYFVSDNVLYLRSSNPLVNVLVLFPSNDPRTEFITPVTVRLIDCFAFSYTHNLQSIDFTHGVADIDDYAFDSSNIKSVKVSSYLSRIGTRAFKNCQNLSSISLKQGLTEIGKDAFFNTPKIKDLYLPNSLSSFSITDQKQGRMLEKTYHVYKNSKAEYDLRKTKKKVKIKYRGTIKLKKHKKINAPNAVKGTGKPDTSWFKEGTTSYKISNPDQLAGISLLLLKRKATFHSVTFTLQKDLNLEKYKNWVPIGGYFDFAGTFDGKGHTIYNLRSVHKSNKVGLFGATKYAKIKNLTLKGATVSGNKYVGILSAYSTETKISNCTVWGSSRGYENTGGILGHSATTKVTNCANYANITGYFYTGGISGVTYDSIYKKCKNFGNIRSSLINSGIGSIDDDGLNNVFNHCENFGLVKGYTTVCGITNQLENKEQIFSCRNHGKIQGRYDVNSICSDYD